jgi:hypothetical protein
MPAKAGIHDLPLLQQIKSWILAPDHRRGTSGAKDAVTSCNRACGDDPGQPLGARPTGDNGSRLMLYPNKRESIFPPTVSFLGIASLVKNPTLDPAALLSL